MAGSKLTRHRVREKLSSCVGHCEAIMSQLDDAAQPFIQHEHKYTEGFSNLYQAAKMLRDLIRDFRDSM